MKYHQKANKTYFALDIFIFAIIFLRKHLEVYMGMKFYETHCILLYLILD